MERVDEGGWPQQPKVFFLKIALHANAKNLQSWCKYSFKYPYIPIDLTLAGDFLTTGWEFRDAR